jgi:Vacuolar sorting 38 and autophagy-related subunit 14
MKCTELSAALSSLTHLLNLSSFYLSVRLPAEVTVPHCDYPLPTIFTPANSYLNKKTPFPGTAAAHLATGTPTASKDGDGQAPPRPRPLFIVGEDEDDKVVQVARKDPVSFAFFLEGLSLLAWDIAWLCRSQGFTTGTETWEDICNIGRNLWQLFFAPLQSSALMRVLSSRDVQERQRLGKETPNTVNAKQKILPRFGEYSHSSAHSFIGAPGAQELFRNWKLTKHTMIVDPLKRVLWAEMNNAEWELLQEQEWDDGGEQFDEAVFIKTRLLDGHEYDDARSIMTTRPGHGDAPDSTGDVGDSARAKGTSGWTKVKNRDK